jgi:hypothetical protein
VEDFQTEDCDEGINLCLTLSQKGETTLSCATEKSKKAGCVGSLSSPGENQQCYCEGDFCNSSSLTKSSILTIFFTLAIFLLS